MSVPSQPNFSQPNIAQKKPAYPGPQRPYMQRNKNYQQKGPRKNERIRAKEVRLIGPDGSQIGIMPPSEALLLAKKCGLDLVEISASANPPVCRIIDFGKYMYEESKKQKSSKKNTNKLKEIKLRPNIDKHDYETKIRHAEEFLLEGNKVKFTLSFRGREMENTQIGFQVINKTIADLKHCSSADFTPKLSGKNISLSLSPSAQIKKADAKKPNITEATNTLQQPFNSIGL